MSEPVVEGKRESFFRSRAWRRFRRNPLAIVGALIVLFFMLVALFAPALTADRMSYSCLRDLGLSKQEAVKVLRNPLNLKFWQATLHPPASCYKIPRKGYSPIPKPPSKKYPLGLSGGGYDIYYGIVWGTRSAFYVGVLVISVGSASSSGGLPGSSAAGWITP